MVTYGFGESQGTSRILGICVKLGRILYEISGVSETIARAAFQIVAYKMPIHTKFITSSRR